jgi:hypothetical protein
MNPPEFIQHLKQNLFKQIDEITYVVLDGASVLGLLDRLSEQRPRHVCLYRGEFPLDLAICAPYLVQLDRESPFTDWLLRTGWGHHCGIFAVTMADLQAMRSHFRRFLIVKDPDDKRLYFRYYDPRVLRIYLPTCNIEEMEFVFGPITYYYLEGENPQALLRISKGPTCPNVEEVLLVHK